MKRLLWIMAAAMTVVTVNSCREEGCIGYPPPEPPASVTISGIYYGERFQERVGYYSIELCVGDEKLRLELLSAVVADPQVPRPLGGTYKLGTLEEPTSKTFFVAENVTSPVGTLYWKNGTPMLVTGGEVTVQLASGGGFTLTVALQAGGRDIDLYYNGYMRFKPELPQPPDPPVEIYPLTRIAYVGDYGDGMGMLEIYVDCREGDRILGLYMTVPGQDDLDKVEIPTGTFQVVKDPHEPYRIVAGHLVDSSTVATLYYSYAREYKESGYPKQTVAVDEGTVTLTRDGDNLGIRADLGGDRLDWHGALPGKVSDIIYRIVPVPAPLYAEDRTRPSSTISGDIKLENLVNAYVDKDIIGPVTDNHMALWRLVFSTENLTVSLVSFYGIFEDLVAKGEGSMIAVQYIGGSESPVGTFPMYDDFKRDTPGRTLPGKPGVSRRLWFYNGIWYMEAKSAGGNCSIVAHAGAMPGRGSVTVEKVETDDPQAADVFLARIEIYDKYGHCISGTATFTIPGDLP